MQIARLNIVLVYIILVCFFLTSSLLSGCGGGGSDGGPGIDAPPALASNQALSGQLISVSHASIQANAVVDVTFQTENTQAMAVNLDGAATVIPVKGIARANGIVDVTVPTFFDANGMPVSHDVRVLINGIASSTILHVENLAELPVSTDGAVLEGFLIATIKHYENTLTNLGTISSQLGGALNPGDAQTAIEATLQDLEDQLFELQVMGTHSIVIDGVNTTLTQQELQQLDKQLLVTLVSIDVAADEANSDLPVAAQHQNTTQLLRDAWARAVAALEKEANSSGGVRQGTRDFVTKGVPDTLDKARETLKSTATYLFGYVSLMTAGAGVLGDKALGVAASRLNMAAAQYSAFSSTINSYWANENTDAFLGDDKDGFNLGQELMSQYVLRLLTAYAGTIQNNIGKLAGGLNTALSLKDVLTEAQVDLCETLGSPALLCSSDTSAPTGNIELLVYVNFDGTVKTLNQNNLQLNRQEADIQISGNLAFPTISWPGNAIGVTVIASNAGGSELIYGVVSEQHPDTGNLIPFNSPLRYGNYRIANTSIANGARTNSPALQADVNLFYFISVQRSDFKSARIDFRLR